MRLARLVLLVLAGPRSSRDDWKLAEPDRLRSRGKRDGRVRGFVAREVYFCFCWVRRPFLDLRFSCLMGFSFKRVGCSNVVLNVFCQMETAYRSNLDQIPESYPCLIVHCTCGPAYFEG